MNINPEVKRLQSAWVMIEVYDQSRKSGWNSEGTQGDPERLVRVRGGIYGRGYLFPPEDGSGRGHAPS